MHVITNCLITLLHHVLNLNPHLQARLASIADQWEFLTQKTTEKSLKLKEANKQRTYIAAVKDLDFWLGEVITTNYTTWNIVRDVLGA